MRDRDTGRSRGFGFVTFANSTEADNAIGNLNEQELDGRRIKVNLANSRSGGGGGGGGLFPPPHHSYAFLLIANVIGYSGGGGYGGGGGGGGGYNYNQGGYGQQGSL